ncbi:SFH1 [Candida pseudojiufengensis]|uniref:SFH1 n=1 Tax=Candida pseudojiufengensis TaxID=497109 RepID=UPI0022259DFB|nr:SFH1 [Candida pseudojiufengensis]KAI5963340.1 SFH1 [Candida pseudojiufengensis]
MVLNELSQFQIQGLASSFSKRLASETNSLLIGSVPTGRQAKRHAQQINYSEEVLDDFDFENTPGDQFSTSGAFASNGTNYNGFNSQRSLMESKTQVDAQKYGPARNTPKFKELDDESNIKNLIGKPEILIPIKLNLETSNGNHKLNDIFMWSLNDSLITPIQFSEILCNDLELPNSMISTIADSIQQQIDEYSYASTLTIPHNNPVNIIIDLSVNLNKQLYQDRIEWDLNQNLVTPEQFAEIVCADLGLSLEFNLAISHALHEIIIRVKKEIIEGSFNNEIHNLHLVKGVIFENGLRIFTENSINNGNDHWEPSVEVLSSSEIEKRENERIRNLRRLKRENMRRDYDDTKRRNVGRRRKHDEDEWRL